jgi:hypothetical protein
MVEREPSTENSPDRLSGEHSPARASEAAQHEDDLSPAKELRDRASTSRSERAGDGTVVGGPITSPPQP